MGRVTKSELNQQTARVLARVVAGEKLVITDHGRPIAELNPLPSSRWDEMVASGFIIPATKTGGPFLGARAVSDVSSAEILRDIRADRS